MLQFNFSSFYPEAGCDEAGRGCLAGPVVAASVILNEFKTKVTENNVKNTYNNLINDSKKLSEKTRQNLRPIIEQSAISFAITSICNQEIDEINILNASMKAMQECILKLSTQPQYIIVDGNRALNAKLGMQQSIGKLFSNQEIEILKSIPNTSIVKGDSKYLSIAAASILAKTYRDDFMNTIHEEYPMYNWKQNKGYPTAEHRQAIQKYGTTKYHRLTFKMF